jgi:hypothetical protein
MSSSNKKLDKAIKKLGDEYKSKLPPNYLEQAVNKKQVNEQQVYDALEEHRFEWRQGAWNKRAAPSWIKDAIQRFEVDLEEAYDNSTINAWIWTPYTRFPIFRDYLGAMESFIETELEGRREWQQEAIKESKPERMAMGHTS